MNEGAGRAIAAVAPAGVISILGLSFSVASLAIGAAACLLVRLPLIRRKNLLAELCLTGLALLGTCVTVIDYKIAPGLSFWTGIGFGAMGTTMIEIGKNVVTSTIRQRLKEAVRIAFGFKDGV